MAKSTRTTISVPEDLKARMDAAGEPVNWSAVACAAFEQKLAEIITRKGAKDMNDVIARLRAASQKNNAKLHQDAYETGQQWAKTSADPDELKRLTAVREARPHEWDMLFGGVDCAYCDGEWVFFTICPDEDGNRIAANDFWETITDDHEFRMGEADFVKGFADGAIDLWLEVRDQI